MAIEQSGKESWLRPAGWAEEEASLPRRRGVAFLLDYIATLLILALSQVISEYVKRHWPLFRLDEVLMVPGFMAMATHLLHSAVLVNLDESRVTGLISVLGMLVTAGWIFYNWVYVYAQDQQSIGKYFVGLRVRRLDGSPLSYGVAARRHLIGYPLSILILGLGLLPILSRPDGRAWHDRIAGTLVESE
ncbi:MAG: RDD family protein [Acidobacteria bacterium]|nr:RDD family protein [Acidobacteriota bacterium]